MANEKMPEAGVLRLDYFPSFLAIETVAGCNLKCSMCPVPNMTRTKESMDMSLYKKIIDEIRYYRDYVKLVQLFMDGEPLLDKTLEEKIRLAKDAGIANVQIATNATLLTEKRAFSLIEAGLDSLIISLDSVGKDIHENIRSGASMDVVVNNVEKMLNLRRESGVKYPRVIMRMLAFQKNQKEWNNYINIWLEKGADEVIIQPLHNWGGAIDINPYKVNTLIKDSFPFCAYPWNMMVVLSDGRVPLCCLDYNPDYEIGSVNNKTLFEIWHSREYAEIRNKHKFGDIEMCTRCDWIPGSVIKDVLRNG